MPCVSVIMARIKKKRVVYISSGIVAVILASIVYSTITVNRSNSLEPPWLQKHDDDVNALVVRDTNVSTHGVVKPEVKPDVEPEVKPEVDSMPGKPTARITVAPSTTTTIIDDHSLSSETRKILKRVPSSFLPEYKNPCWMDSGDQLTCLPYYYVIGTIRSGTTEVWRKLNLHPEVVSVPKEPHWWGPRRNGWMEVTAHVQEVLEIRKVTGDSDDSSIDWYLNWWKKFGVGEVATELPSSQRWKIFGDGSTTTSYAIGTAWSLAGGDVSEPPCTNAELLHAVQPDAKIIMMVRDPVEQARSWYFFIHPHEDEDSFHMHVEASITCYRQCLEGHSERYCAYAFQCGRPWFQGINVGLYYIYLKDWIDAFSRKGVLVLRLEDWNADQTAVYKQILQFLDLRSLTVAEEQSILGTRWTRFSQRSMRPDTRQILTEFYRPFNTKLAELLEDQRFDYSK